jgi:hypothetical protein
MHTQGADTATQVDAEAMFSQTSQQKRFLESYQLVFKAIKAPYITCAESDSL